MKEWKWITPIGWLVILTGGCAHNGPRRLSSEYSSIDTGEAIRRAVEFLEATQVRSDEAYTKGDFLAGDWPQYGVIGRGIFRRSLPDTSCFSATFIHHSLCLLREGNAKSLKLDKKTIDAATRMRDSAIHLMHRFEYEDESSANGSFGYWLRRSSSATPWQRLKRKVTLKHLGGPRYNGTLAPLRIDHYPDEMMFWPDADCTAVVNAAFALQKDIDGVFTESGNFEKLFEIWRDRPSFHRSFPEWIPQDSGAFLTWFDDPPGCGVENDIDLVVNANVLFALGICGGENNSGVVEAAAILSASIREGRHHDIREVSRYYENNFFFQYAVSRAYREGGVRTLEGAVDQLANEIEAQAIQGPSRSIFWDLGQPQFNTACAVITLINAGRRGETVEGGIRFLLAKQDPKTGSWEELISFVGVCDSGVPVYWRSQAHSTAFALEALCRYELMRSRGSAGAE